jgi:hypothetical protein
MFTSRVGSSRMRERRRVLAVTAIAPFFSVLVWLNYSTFLPLVVEE